MNEIRKKLSAKFRPDEIEWRIMRCGKKDVTGEVWAVAVAYVTNRAIQNRLDDTFGIFGWKNIFTEWHGDSQLCGISVWDKDKNDWITKFDGADQTQFEGTKGGLSDSMKRAGYQWDIGRYLYRLDETWVNTSIDKVFDWNYEAVKKTRDGKIKCPAFYWETPSLPSWAYPEGFEPDASVQKEVQKYREKNKPKKFDEELGKKIKSMVIGSPAKQKNWIEFKNICGERYPECNNSLANIFADHGQELFEELVKDGVEKFLQNLPY